MKRFKWLEGRQEETIYFKWCFLYNKIWKLGFDGYILKYPPKTWLKPHKDPVLNGKHYRLNIILKGSKYDEFKSDRVIFNLFNRIILFRPDLYIHSVTIFTKDRYVLSLGIVKFS